MDDEDDWDALLGRRMCLTARSSLAGVGTAAVLMNEGCREQSEVKQGCCC